MRYIAGLPIISSTLLDVFFRVDTVYYLLRIPFVAFLFSFFFLFYLPHFARIEGKIELGPDSSRFIPS